MLFFIKRNETFYQAHDNEKISKYFYDSQYDKKVIKTDGLVLKGILFIIKEQFIYTSYEFIDLSPLSLFGSYRYKVIENKELNDDLIIKLLDYFYNETYEENIFYFTLNKKYFDDILVKYSDYIIDYCNVQTDQYYIKSKSIIKVDTKFVIIEKEKDDIIHDLTSDLGKELFGKKQIEVYNKNIQIKDINLDNINWLKMIGFYPNEIIFQYFEQQKILVVMFINPLINKVEYIRYIEENEIKEKFIDHYSSERDYKIFSFGKYSGNNIKDQNNLVIDKLFVDDYKIFKVPLNCDIEFEYYFI